MPSFSSRVGAACPAPSSPESDDLKATAPPAIVLMNVRRSCGFRLMGGPPGLPHLAESSPGVTTSPPPQRLDLSVSGKRIFVNRGTKLRADTSVWIWTGVFYFWYI